MAPVYTFTTWAEIESYYSTVAAGLITDDLTGDDLTTFKTWVINLSTEEVTLFLGTRYKDLQSLSQSTIVRMWATILAAYRVSTRRGNPELFQGARDETISYLKQVQNNELSLPDVNANTANTPSMANYTTDPRHLVNGIRVAHDSFPISDPANTQPRYPQYPRQ